MFKTMLLLTRASHISQAELINWWMGRHNDLAKTLPGIRRIIVNIVENGPICGVTELWFDTKEDFAAALGSAEGQAALADAQGMVADLQMLHVVEHEMFSSQR